MANSGCCAIDLGFSPENYVVSSPRNSEPEIIIEGYAVGVDGEMRVLGPREDIPLSFQVRKGYMFEI